MSISAAADDFYRCADDFAAPASGGRVGNKSVAGELLGQKGPGQLYNKLIKSIV
jgi:hypothetical protein